MSRYLVTGATGFLGRHLLSHLLGAGHEVVALCRKAPSELGQERFSVKIGDVLDAASIREAAAGCEGLFHCAGRVSRKPEDAEALFRVHVEGTKITLDAARAAGVKRVILASTSGTIALNQCKDLTNNIVPAVRAAGGGYAPTVVAGDWNLKYRGSPDAQACVPGGYYRKGDGDVQHFLATSDLAFSSSKTVPMSHTDHDGWFVAVTAP